MSIAQGHEDNFNTLSRAFENGDVCLMECIDAKSGETVVAICMVNQIHDEFQFVPVAKMFNGNPYEELIPPTGELQ